MNCLDSNVCHIEDCGFAFGACCDHLYTAKRVIIRKDFPFVYIQFDNRGAYPARKRNQHGGFVAGGSAEAKATGRVGSYFRFEVINGVIRINLMEEVK